MVWFSGLSRTIRKGSLTYLDLGYGVVGLPILDWTSKDDFSHLCGFERIYQWAYLVRRYVFLDIIRGRSYINLEEAL